MPGPEIQANAIETAVRGFPLRSSSRVANVFLIILLVLKRSKSFSGEAS